MKAMAILVCGEVVVLILKETLKFRDPISNVKRILKVRLQFENVPKPQSRILDLPADEKSTPAFNGVHFGAILHLRL